MRRLPAIRRLLVVAPHPDDEAIGAWGLMRSLGRSGARIEVVVVSDGAASHPNSRSWPAPRLVRERRRESRRAAASLAIPRQRVRFLSLPDGALDRHSRRLASLLTRAIGRCTPADLIVGPVADDAHGDHRAVARAIASVPRRGERRLGYRVWPCDARRRGAAVRVRLDGRALAMKRRIVRSFRTQMGIITDAEAGFAMTTHHVRAFVRPTETFTVLS